MDVKLVGGKQRGHLRRCVQLGTMLALVSFAFNSQGLAWPDVAEQIERGLESPDPQIRQAAARDIAALGAKRGAALALRSLEDPDDDVRIAAADAVIHLKVIAASEQLIGWLNAREARVRRKACDVLRAIPTPRAVAPLARTLGDPVAEVRQAAAEALAAQGSAEAVAPLLGRLDDSAPQVRIQIVQALARLKDLRAVVPLVGKVQDSAPEVRQAVAHALGELGDSRAAQSLVLQLRDNNPDVKREAIESLGRLRAKDAVDALATMLNERQPVVRAATHAALGRIGTSEAVAILAGLLGTSDDGGGALEPTTVRDALVTAGATSIPALRNVLANPPTPLAANSAAYTLGELRAKSETALVIATMRKGSLAPAAALHALGSMGATDGVPVILEYIGDRSPVVRAEASRAAMKLLDPRKPDGRAVEPLAAVLRDPRPSAEERVLVTRLLGQTGAARAGTLLAELARAGDRDLRIAAIDALGQLGASANADAPLIVALGSTDANERLRAASALAQAGTKDALRVLIGKLDSSDEIDKRALFIALAGLASRYPSDEATKKLAQRLELSAGGERDSVIEAIGRSPSPTAFTVLRDLARSPTIEDRRAAATFLAAHGKTAGAVSILQTLARDRDVGVRAEAAWALGAATSNMALPIALTLASNSDPYVSVNAFASIGRLAQPGQASAFSAALCAAEQHPHPYVRVNALAALAQTKTRCRDGSKERLLLLTDPSEHVRAAAADALWATRRDPDDGNALSRCAALDPVGMVAQKCRNVDRESIDTRTHAVLIYPLSETQSQPSAASPFAVQFANGFVRLGLTDRRGATSEPLAPSGDVLLLRPNP